jgi:hypothetical protein
MQRFEETPSSSSDTKVSNSQTDLNLKLDTFVTIQVYRFRNLFQIYKRER